MLELLNEFVNVTHGGKVYRGEGILGINRWLRYMWSGKKLLNQLT